MATATESTHVIGPCYSFPLKIDQNPIEQVIIDSQEITCRTSEDGEVSFTVDGRDVRVASEEQQIGDGELLLILDPLQIDQLADHRDLSNAQWHHGLEHDLPEAVLDGYIHRTRIIEEDKEAEVEGLREPQVGALYALKAYWRTRRLDPVTIVMPTGTGKTEVMISTFCMDAVGRILILVPSEALRSQIYERFASLGILKSIGVVDRQCPNPVLGRVEHAFTTDERAFAFARHCNVVVATPDALAACAISVRNAFCDQFDALFVDEAHHVAARTWDNIKSRFVGKAVVQFTATPYREDRTPLGGRIIFDYPLKEAQARGFYSKINYKSVVSLGREDEKIAEEAVGHLEADLEQYDHILMARVHSIRRANEILKIYQKLAPQYSPVILHSRLPAAEVAAGKAAILSRDSRIVVCVDMLGEGFDLASLKIAALHDPHKTLGITLQFIGRFSRMKDGLGDATVVLARPVGHFDERLRDLYGEDPEWNALINDLSREAIENEEEIAAFNAGFVDEPDDISPLSLFPKMSTVVYRTPRNVWFPEHATEVHPEDSLFTFPIPINYAENVAWFVKRIETPVRWGDGETLDDVTFELFVLHFDPDNRLLYINSSANQDHHKNLAEAVCEGSRIISGEEVYRVFGRMDWLVPTNVGLLETANQNRSFWMLSGDDVGEGFPVADAQTKSKTNIYGWGYEFGERVGYGASLRGRLWSFRVAKTLKYWVDWCESVGDKLIDETIDVAAVQEHFIRPKRIAERPELVPLAMQWPNDVISNFSENCRVIKDGDDFPVADIGLEILSLETTGPILFNAVTDSWTAQYQVEFTEDGLTYVPVGDDVAMAGRTKLQTLSDFMNREGLYIIFEQETLVSPSGLLFKVDRDLPSFPIETAVIPDWTGVSLSVESQGADLRADSIQRRMIEFVLQDDWDVVIDDDRKGEIADIVCLRQRERELQIQLVHCKFSSKPYTGARVKDLYEVCGQAERSVQWKRFPLSMLENLLRRERNRRSSGYRNGLMKGADEDLVRLLDECKRLRPKLTICIAQPGLSKAAARDSESVLQLLASTDTAVRIRTGGDFIVFANE